MGEDENLNPNKRTRNGETIDDLQRIIEEKNNNNISKSKNIPIITTYNINVREISIEIDKALGHCNYNVKLMGRNATNIGVCTLVDFEKVKTFLTELKVNFYTYTPKGLRPYSLVIEGLSGTYSVEDVKGYLDGLKIRLEIIRIVNLGNECFNCQCFGHTSANCHMPYRCVKCGASHGPGNCSIPPKGEDNMETLVTDPVTGQATRRIGHQVRCVNCGVDGHTASSRECPRRLELLRKIEAKRVPGGGRRAQGRTGDSNVRAGVSYATAASSGTTRGVSSVTAVNNGPLAGSSGIDLRGAMAQFGGGTAVLVRDSLSCERILIDTGTIENTTVRIHRVSGGDLTVVSLYRRSQDPLLVSDLNPIFDLSNDGGVLIGGDLNARHSFWGDSVTDTSGRTLYDLLLNNPNMVIHPTEGHTRITDHSSSYIDIIMTSVDMAPILTGNGLRTLDFELDHRAVEVIFSITDCVGRIRPTRFDFDKMDRIRFNNILSEGLTGCVLPTDTNVTVGDID
ncbi:hypothetical protein CVS40_11566 [Lucilia cuprina]|nr:hypothetical protein CVS40_11566 [Lucilia cuprina]